jgi:lysyl-tRNA synthetase class 1
MASSTGVAITIDSMLEIVPPDVLRYLIARSKPEKATTFDPGMGLLTLIDEYAKVAEKGDSREYELSKISSVATDIPFRHLVTVVQIATDDNAIIDVLKRSGYDVKNKEAVLKRAQRAKIWIEKYAPDMVKFTVQEKLPQEVYSINDKERYALEILASKMEGLSEWNAENLHNAVYKTGDEADTNPKDIFTCIYMAILGKERGPRAGWFLEALGREFVTKRIVEAVSAGAQ